jgi:hypothetical protein
MSDRALIPLTKERRADYRRPDQPTDLIVAIDEGTSSSWSERFHRIE